MLWVLVTTNVITIVVALALGSAWLITIVLIARSKRIKALSILRRFVFLSILGVLLAVGFIQLGNWVLGQSNLKQKTQMHQAEKVDKGLEKGGAPLPAKGESTSPSKKKVAKHPLGDSLDIVNYCSKEQIVIYNPGERKIFISHLSLSSEKYPFSNVMLINETIDGKQYFHRDIKPKELDLKKFGTNIIPENSWQKILLNWPLKDSGCVQWFLFASNDPGYQTIKEFHKKVGDINFREIPINASLYFRSVDDGHQSNKNFSVYAIPLINRSECGDIFRQ
ncbi:MAG: hypothetical protein ABSB79_04000 [Syntrophales bacterium]